MSEATWKARLGQIGCVLCTRFGLAQRGRTYLHHVREGQGMSQRASDYLCIPLCWEHHVGADGVHVLGKGGLFQRFKLDEIGLLELTLKAMDGG